MTDVTQRFSSRVENYIKYRPSYPSSVVDLLVAECGLTTASVVADIGSGTGLLAELFLNHGNRVYGVEPNLEMRAAGKRLLQHYAHFTSVDGTAESTTLEAGSIDYVTAGQAFHWFDRERAKTEWTRILKPQGWVVLVWNERRTASTPFLQAYEQLLVSYGTDYEKVNHQQIDLDVLRRFMAPAEVRQRSFPNNQSFDFDGLKGRLLSSSYTPEAGHLNHEPMLRELRGIFDAHQLNGRVTFEYDTKVYYGQLPG